MPGLERVPRLTRRALIGGTSCLLTMPVGGARAQPKAGTTIRVGVLTDLSGPLRDAVGPVGVACARQAVQEFAASHDLRAEVQEADFQLKPDVAVSIARQWFDQDGVDVIVEVVNSAAALAVSGVAREKNKVLLVSGAATSELTGKQCSPNTIHWPYDTWMLAHSTATQTLRAGGDTWYLVAPDYAFGHALAGDTAKFVLAAGGKVVGTAFYPYPDTTDFSGYLQQAQASGAKVLGICASAGADSINLIKQAYEFGVPTQMQLAGMLIALSTVHGIGIETAQGLHLTETFYWDLNDRTRAFTKRVLPKTAGVPPNMFQAGNYSAILHYLKTVADMGAAAAKADGRATVDRMKQTPTDDDCFGPGRIREDGRKLHPSYLFQVKKPVESKQEWDLYNLIATTPAEQAFRPLNEGGCPLVRS